MVKQKEAGQRNKDRENVLEEALSIRNDNEIEK